MSISDSGRDSQSQPFSFLSNFLWTDSIQIVTVILPLLCEKKIEIRIIFNYSLGLDGHSYLNCMRFAWKAFCCTNVIACNLCSAAGEHLNWNWYFVAIAKQVSGIQQIQEYVSINRIAKMGKVMLSVGFFSLTGVTF